MDKSSKELRDLCEILVDYLRLCDSYRFKELINNLEWCIGSFDYDYNPIGLIEYGEEALRALNQYLQNNPNGKGEVLKESLEKILSH